VRVQIYFSALVARFGLVVGVIFGNASSSFWRVGWCFHGSYSYPSGRCRSSLINAIGGGGTWRRPHLRRRSRRFSKPVR
jgi:hypothetical protein